MISPILLCGGSGTRLWPLSRKSYPKQFTNLTGEESLFQASAKLLSGESFSDPVVLTNSDFRFIVTEQLKAIDMSPGAILIEPASKNTGPAVLAAALALEKTAPGNLMLVAPSDHVVPDAEAFREAIEAGRPAAEAGQIVTFGIKPTRPEIAYGWIELKDQASAEKLAPVEPVRFVEKPDEKTAKQMFASGSFLWNSGIFLMSVQAVIEAFKTHAPSLVPPVRRAVENARSDLGFSRLAPEPWTELEGISIDYAIMEKAENMTVVPYGAGWSDLGSWDSVWREMEPDSTGVATDGPATAIDCTDTLLRAEDPAQQVVGIGLDNIIAVAMPDAVLVADKSRSQDVRRAVEVLKASKVSQAEQLPRDYRPWGWFETLALGNRFQVKRIVVHPGAALSLQSHVHRSEHWIVVAGTAKVTVDETVKLVAENQSVYIPLGAVHRMENPGKVPMVLIEVQTGAYLGEDDIKRYEDVYARESSE